MVKPQRPLKPKPGKRPVKKPALLHAGRIVIKKKEPKTIRLKLVGPTSFAEGRGLAEELNVVIAAYNTQYFMDSDGTLRDPRIAAKTDPPA